MPRGMGQKTGDQWAVPLCPAHHSQLHLCGKNEKDFWKTLDIDAEDIACTLYQWWLDDQVSKALFTDESILWVKIYNNLVPKLKKNVDFLMQPKL